jgi:hypothetical protein
VSGFTVTLATAADRAELAAFTCGIGTPHLDEVNDYVNHRVLHELLGGSRADQGFRVVLVREAGELVAVSAHEAIWRSVGEDGKPLAGTEIVLFALAAGHQGRRLPDERSVFRVALGLVLDDVAGCNRGEWLTMVVRNTNEKMLAICRSLDNIVEVPMRGGAVASRRAFERYTEPSLRASQLRTAVGVTRSQA